MIPIVHDSYIHYKMQQTLSHTHATQMHSSFIKNNEIHTYINITITDVSIF